MPEHAATAPTEPTSALSQVITSIQTSFLDMANSLANFIPNLIIALIIICVGVIIAKVIRTVLTKILQGIQVDTILEKTGLTAPLAKMGVTGSLAILIPKVLGAFIIIFMIKSAADAARFEDVSNIIELMFAFIPKLVTAFIIMVIGMFVGDIVQQSVYTALDNKGLDYANTLSKIIFGLVFVVFLTVSLSQVDIETELLQDSVKILLLACSLAVAIALGLGLKSHANNIVAAVYVRDIYRQGSQIEVDGELLTIKGTGPVTTKLQKDNGEFIVLPNSYLVSEKVKGKTSV